MIHPPTKKEQLPTQPTFSQPHYFATGKRAGAGGWQLQITNSDYYSAWSTMALRTQWWPTSCCCCCCCPWCASINLQLLHWPRQTAQNSDIWLGKPTCQGHKTTKGLKKEKREKRKGYLSHPPTQCNKVNCPSRTWEVGNKYKIIWENFYVQLS